jgi:hypothetical protein
MMIPRCGDYASVSQGAGANEIERSTSRSLRLIESVLRAAPGALFNYTHD